MPANQSTSRIQNQREILDLLLMEGNLSRADLAKRLGLSKPAIAENVERLIAAGLVLDAGEGVVTHKGGRRPRMITFNSTYRYIIGIDLRYRRPVFAIGDLTGTIHSQTRLKYDKDDDDETLLSAFFTAIRQLMAAQGISGKDLGAIALCAPGPLHCGDGAGGKAGRRWSHLTLSQRLENVFEVPVIQTNDINAAALAEFAVGCGGNCTNMVFVNCGDELGAGLILRGELYEGSHKAAGEIDYFTNRQLYFQRKTLEEEIGIDGLLSRIERDILEKRATELVEAVASSKDSLQFEDVVSAYRRGDEYIAGLIRTIGEELGFVLSNMATLLDLELIVLGGEYLSFFEQLKQEILKIMEHYCIVIPRVEPSFLGSKAGLYGGLLLARDALLAGLKL